MAKRTRKYNIFYILIIFSISVIFLLFAYTLLKSDSIEQDFYQNIVRKREKDLPFLYFINSDNITGYSYFIVPNIVHYVLFGIREIGFAQYVSILSVLKNQKPDIIFIHCDCDQMNGYYYQKVIERVKQSKTVFEVRRIEKPKEIFGKSISKKWRNWHSSDITRLWVLQEFGGIYLDSDVYVVKSLDEFRKFEMTINWDVGLFLGNQVIIAHRNARFLHRWIDTYHDYDEEKWYFNAGELPTKSILYKYPELVHRMTGEFGTNGPVVCPKLFSSYYSNWRQEFYAIHLVIRGDEIALKDWCFGDNKPEIMKFNETVAKQLSVTFGEMYRDLFI